MTLRQTRQVLSLHLRWLRKTSQSGLLVASMSLIEQNWAVRIKATRFLMSWWLRKDGWEHLYSKRVALVLWWCMIAQIMANWQVDISTHQRWNCMVPWCLHFVHVVCMLVVALICVLHFATTMMVHKTIESLILLTIGQSIVLKPIRRCLALSICSRLRLGKVLS